MKFISASTAVPMVCLLSGTVPLAAQGVTVRAGSAWPVGRFSELQDAGPMLAVGLEQGARTGGRMRGILGYAKFRADEGQSPIYADGPWLPFDVELWTLTAQWVHRTEAAPFAAAPFLGLGVDYFRSPRVYDFEGPRSVRELYPSVEVGLEAMWSPVERIDFVGGFAGRVMITRKGATERLFEAAGSRAGDEDGSHWLAYVPIGLGIRVRL
jgi:hypothetical protein